MRYFLHNNIRTISCLVIAWASLTTFLPAKFTTAQQQNDPNTELSNSSNSDTLTISSSKPRFSVSIRDMNPVNYLEGITYVASKTPISVQSRLTEPDEFKNLTHHYLWQTKNVVVSNTNSSLSSLQFNNADNNERLNLTVAVFEQTDNKTEHIAQDSIPLVVQDPVTISDLKNRMNILKNETLNLRFDFNGSGPYKYCYDFRYNNTNADLYKKCDTTKQNFVNIQRWFHYVGSYKMVFEVENIVSKARRTYMIKISETVHKKSLPFVPIICSILAMFLLITGIAVNLKYRRAVNIETANFDWLQGAEPDDDYDEEDDGRVDFLQRLVKTLLWFKRDPPEDELNITTGR